MTKYKVLETNQRKALSVLGFLSRCILENLDEDEFALVRENLKDKFKFFEKIDESNYREIPFPLSVILKIQKELDLSDNPKLKALSIKVGFSKKFITKISREECKKDVIRTNFLLKPNETIKQIQTQVFGNLDELLYFSQGDFMGGFYADVLINMSTSARSKKTEKDSQDPYDSTLQFGYIDDNGIPCGLCISRVGYDPHRYFFSHTKNCNSPLLEERQQTIIYDEGFYDEIESSPPNLSSPAMLEDGNPAPEITNKVITREIDRKDAFESLLSVLNSDNAKRFVKGLFDENGNLLSYKFPKYKEILYNTLSDKHADFYLKFIEKYKIINAPKLSFEFFNHDNYRNLLINLIHKSIDLPQRSEAFSEYLKFVLVNKEYTSIRDELLNPDFFQDVPNSILIKIQNETDLVRKSSYYSFYLEYIAMTTENTRERLRIFEKIRTVLDHPQIINTEIVELANVQKLVTQAQDKVREEDAILNFDPQGRLLVELKDCLVSLDITEDIVLRDKYNETLRKYLINSQIPQEKVTNILTAFNDLKSKNSIIFLQQEMYFQLSLALEVYKKQFDKISEDYSISAETMRKVNVMVMQVFAEALVAATEDKTINIETLNSILDKKRLELAEKAHYLLVEEIKPKFNLDLREFNLKKAQKEAPHTTATNKKILHVDRYLNTVTEIEGSDCTSHYREQGMEFAHRAIRTYRVDNQLEVKYQLNGLQVRTPSLPVKKGLSEQEYIDDTVVKINKLVADYHLNKPFTYNLFTAMQHRFDDLYSNNKQTLSARHIILGAHTYNRQVHNKFSTNYCLIQAISVNGFGRALGYHRFGFGVNLPNEATLLAEMSLCYNMGQKNIINRYKDFLEPKDSKGFFEKIFDYFKSPYFVTSIQGQDLRKQIAKQKTEWQGRREVNRDDNTDLVCTSLQKIMAYNLHFSHDYAKLIQALSIFLEDESILGCKSGNERTPIIMEREQLLKQINIPSDLIDAFVKVAHARNKSETIKALNNLKITVNKYYNDENLYGASALIPLVDQGAGHKISAKNGFELNSNKAEDQRSEKITNLKQSNVRNLQAQNGLPDYMNAAVEKYKLSNKLTAEIIVDDSTTKVLKGVGYKNIDKPSVEYIAVNIEEEPSHDNSSDSPLIKETELEQNEPKESFSPKL